MTEESLVTMLVGLGIFLVIFLIIFAAFAVVFIIGRWKFFKKAGKNGWEAIIPFYSDWVLVEVAGLDWYWFLALIANAILSVLSSIIPLFGALSFLGYVAVILARVCIFFNLSKRLHKDTSWIVLGALFAPIMITIAGFSNSITYDATVPVTKNGVFDKDKQQ